MDALGYLDWAIQDTRKQMEEAAEYNCEIQKKIDALSSADERLSAALQNAQKTKDRVQLIWGDSAYGAGGIWTGNLAKQTDDLINSSRSRIQGIIEGIEQGKRDIANHIQQLRSEITDLDPLATLLTDLIFRRDEAEAAEAEG